jgi:hypothetical protein
MERSPPPTAVPAPTSGPEDASPWLDAARDGMADLVALHGAVWDAVVHWSGWSHVPHWLGEVFTGSLQNAFGTALAAGLLGYLAWLRAKGNKAIESGAANQRSATPTAESAPHDQAAVSPCALSPQTLSRLRDLLLGLPRWDEEQKRRTIVTLGLGPGHTALNHIAWGGSADDSARAVIAACVDCRGPAVAEQPTLCALLAAIRREYDRFGPNPARAAEIAELQALLACA